MDSQFATRAVMLLCERRWPAVATPNPSLHRTRYSGLRHPDRSPTRQVAFFARTQASPLPFTERMKAAIDSARGRALHGRRIATVAPVFANLRHNKPLDRFAPRSGAKVNEQWRLYCLVHNIEKLAHHGYARSHGGFGRTRALLRPNPRSRPTRCNCQPHRDDALRSGSRNAFLHGLVRRRSDKRGKHGK